MSDETEKLRHRIADLLLKICYHFNMKTAKTDDALECLVGPLADCLTPEAARRVLALKANGRLQARVNFLAEQSAAGSLRPEEQAEYGDYVQFGTFIAILKSKARQSLANSDGER